jgi:hypothetical protein
MSFFEERSQQSWPRQKTIYTMINTPKDPCSSSCQQVNNLFHQFVNTKWLAQGSRGFLLLFLHWIYRQRESVTLHWVQVASILRWAIVVKEIGWFLNVPPIFLFNIVHVTMKILGPRWRLSGYLLLSFAAPIDVLLDVVSCQDVGPLFLSFPFAFWMAVCSLINFGRVSSSCSICSSSSLLWIKFSFTLAPALSFEP